MNTAENQTGRNILLLRNFKTPSPNANRFNSGHTAGHDLMSLTLHSNTQPRSEEFLRKGKVGDWENHISEKDSTSLDAMTDSYFKRTTRKFIYKLD